MATESFSRTFTVNPDWGIKNLEKAIDNGSRQKWKQKSRRGMASDTQVYGTP